MLRIMAHVRTRGNDQFRQKQTILYGFNGRRRTAADGHLAEGVGFEPSGLANIFEGASSFESHSPRQHLPNSVYHVRRSSFPRCIDSTGEHTAGDA